FIYDSDHGSFDRHVLVADRGTSSSSVSANDGLTYSRAETIGDHDHICVRFPVEIEGMHDQKPHALEIRRLLRRPDGTDYLSQKHTDYTWSEVRARRRVYRSAGPACDTR